MLHKSTYEQHQFSDYFKTNLPHHWCEKRLGFLAAEEKAAFVDGPFGSDLKSSDYLDEGVPLIQLNNIRDSKHLMQNMKFVSEEKKQELFRHIAIPGDIVIAKMADPVARAAIVNEAYQQYVIVADCVKFTPNLKLINLRFLVWAINCDYVRINAELVSTGTTRVRINLGELKKLKIPYPSEPEQIAIANFLDHETAKIDTLIEKQQQLIQLLKEKRQAVISHAVTKGLNPNAPMKDSGVEWLGQVPEHWHIKKFNHCVSIRNGLVDPTADPYRDYTLIAPNHIESGTGKILGLETAAEQGADSGKYICKKGEVIYSKIRPALAKVCISRNDETICSADMYPMAGMGGLSNEFLFLTLLSNWFTSLVILESDRVAMPKINREKLAEVKIPVPPEEEQRCIQNYVFDKTYAIDELLNKAFLAIEIMQERRTALISAAVTGKIDVRNWQAPTN